MKFTHTAKISIFLKKIKFKSQSMQFKLICAFIFVSILPIFILQLLYFSYSGVEITKKISDMTKNNLGLVCKNIDTTLSSNNDVLVQITSNDDLLKNYSLFGNPYYNIRLSAQRKISDELDTLTFSKEGLKAITLYDGGSRQVCFNRLNQDIRFWGNNEELDRIYTEAIKTARPIVDAYPIVRSNSEGRHYLINYAKRITDLQTLQAIGVAVISIDESTLYQACNNEDNGFEQSFQSYSFIINDQNIIISSPNKSMIGSKVKTSSSSDDNVRFRSLVQESDIFPDQPVIINSMAMPAYGWKVVNVINKRTLFSEIQFSQIIDILMAGVCVILSLMLAYLISKSLSSSVRTVVQAMKTAQKGEYSIQVDVDSNDEISIIAKAFNAMMGRINLLIQQLNLQMRKVYEATQKQKDAEIRALEAQISPHFLYNTLDTINWMAIEKEEYEISQMLKSLASILRYSIEDSNKIVRIESEVNWMEQYLYLQKNRFDNSFEYTVDIPGEIQQLYTYKLLLQPFVENAILHGLAECKKNGRIDITARFCKDDSIAFVVKDNGAGMDSRTLDELNTYDGEDRIAEKEGHSSIGIKNVKNRLRMYFEDKASCLIHSEPGKGTTVTLVIPPIYKGEIS